MESKSEIISNDCSSWKLDSSQMVGWQWRTMCPLSFRIQLLAINVSHFQWQIWWIHGLPFCMYVCQVVMNGDAKAHFDTECPWCPKDISGGIETKKRLKCQFSGFGSSVAQIRLKVTLSQLAWLSLLGVGLNNCHQSLRWAKQTSFGLNLLQWKASLLLLLEKRKPSTNAAMQGVQKMQQAIVCWMRRKMRGRRRRRTRRWSTGRRRRSTWWRWEESREEEGGGGQCSPNLLLWISSSAVHLSQPVCPLPSCCFG